MAGGLLTISREFMESGTDEAGTSRSPECLAAWEKRKLFVPSLVVAAALAILPITGPVYRHSHSILHALPMDSYFATAVQFASSTVAIAIAALVVLLDPAHRRYVPYFLVALILAGNLNMLVKITAGRARPTWGVALSHSNRDELMKGSASDQVIIERAGLDKWLWMGHSRRWLDDRYNSFPSGHAVSAFVTAAFLCLLYARARVVWLVLAISCAAARVRFRRHFPEDVMVGGALGWIVSMWVFSWCWPMRLGAWLEVRIKALRRQNRHGKAGELKVG